MKFLIPLVIFACGIEYSIACQGLAGGSLPSLSGVGGGLGGGGGPTGEHSHDKKRKCLHVDADVRMADGSFKKAGEIIVGDQVWGENGQPSPVVLTPKLYAKEMESFIRFKTESGHGTTLTPVHAVFARPCGLSADNEWPIKRAGDLTTGECVPTEDGSEDRVVSVRAVELEGLVQPITESGKIATGGVFVSCYDYTGKKFGQREQHAPYEPARMLYGWAEKIYNTMSDEQYALGTLEGLIRSLGLEKLYNNE